MTLESSGRQCFASLLFTFLLVGQSPPAFSQESSSPSLTCATSGSESRIRIASLYRKTPTGRRQHEGVRAALAAPGLLDRMCLSAHRYPTEAEGLRIAEGLLEQTPPPHVIIGPTDSGVFRQLELDQDKLEAKQVTVVSPLVIAELGNDPEGWLFRTNVSARDRAATLHTFLNQRAVGTIEVIYSDSEFGLRAEEEFRNGLSPMQLERYASTRYTNLAELRRSARQVVSNRPAAVGVLGPREDVEDFFETFGQSNHGVNPYWPIKFTAVDTKLFQLNGLYYVSLESEPELEEALSSRVDEVSGLAQDTMSLVIQAFPGGLRPNEDGWRQQFRHDLVGLLEGPSSAPGGKTGMTFRSFQNAAKPGVYSIIGGDLVHEDLDSPPDLVDVMMAQLGSIFRQHGLAPVINLIVLAAIVIYITSSDVRSWCDIRNPGWNLRQKMAGLVVFNVGVAIFVYLGLIALGAIEWRNFAGAISVALGYPMLLKSKLGETSTGKTIGLADIYENALMKIEDRVGEAMYGERDNVIDFIAAASPIDKLTSVLENWYSYRRSERASQLISQLNQEIKAARTRLAARRLCARKIRLGHDFEQLVRLKLVPEGVLEKDIISPEDILQMGVDYCVGLGRIPPAKLKAMVEEKLLEAEKEEGRDVSSDRKELEECLDRSASDRGRTRCYLRWLFLIYNYQIADIIHAGLLPRDALEDATNHAAHASAALERRQYQRSDIDLPCEATPFDYGGQPGTPYTATLRNVSEGGALVEIPDFQPSTDVAGLTIKTSEDETATSGVWLRRIRADDEELFALTWQQEAPALRAAES